TSVTLLLEYRTFDLLSMIDKHSRADVALKIRDEDIDEGKELIDEFGYEIFPAIRMRYMSTNEIGEFVQLGKGQDHMGRSGRGHGKMEKILTFKMVFTTYGMSCLSVQRKFLELGNLIVGIHRQASRKIALIETSKSL
nr:hypothetical protein [Tanacetum cinerariifolium]